MANRYTTLNHKADILKVARLTPPRSNRKFDMHPDEPELARQWFVGEIESSQVVAALKAMGFRNPNPDSRLGRVLRVARDLDAATIDIKTKRAKA